jgi:hypothetical protein
MTTSTLHSGTPTVVELQKRYLSLGVIFGIIGLVLWILAVRGANFLSMGAMGLVSVLSWTYFAGLFLVVAGFVIELMKAPLRTGRLTLLLAILVVVIYGTASAVEPVAGITDSWVHACFIQYIVQHGRPLNGYDARFSWPGGFSLAAVLVSWVGKSSAYSFLRWFPLVIELCYLAPLIVIAKNAGVTRRAAWLGVALYYATNWIFQDYFSPQALNYLFFLVVIAAVLACWHPRPREGSPERRGYWRERVDQSRAIFTRTRLEGFDAKSEWSPARTATVLALVAVICFASAMSHQLTPYAIVLALAACLITRRLGRPELVILAGILAVGWLSLGASNFWVGHLSTIFGSVGAISSSVGSNVTNHVTGNASHLFIVKLRILITAALYLLTGIGFFRRWTNSRLLEVLVAAPFLLVLAQDYGGEGLLRVVLFGLPFTSLLAASAILPGSSGTISALAPRIDLSRSRRLRVPLLRFRHLGRVLLALVMLVVLLGFAIATVVVRGGNDSYEAYSTGELDAINYVYKHAQDGQAIGVVSSYMPVGQEKILSVPVYVADFDGSSTIKQIDASFLSTHPTWVVLSQSQEAWGELVAGYPVEWEANVEVGLVQKGYAIVKHWRTATVLRFTKST